MRRMHAVENALFTMYLAFQIFEHCLSKHVAHHAHAQQRVSRGHLHVEQGGKVWRESTQYKH